MSTESTKDTTTHSQTDPWAPQAGALTTAFDAAGKALTKAQGAVAPTDFTAQMSPEALASFRQMIAQGGNLGVSNGQAATGTALQNAGVGGVQGALSGLSSFDPTKLNNTSSNIDAANAYAAGQDIPGAVRAAMQSATEQARDVTMPGIEQNAATGGNTNSTRTGVADGIVQRGLAEQAGNLSSTMHNAAYGQGLSLAQQAASDNNAKSLGALTSSGTIGNSAAGTGVNAGSASVANQGALTSEMAAGGAGMTAAQQAILDNQAQQYASKTGAPFDAIRQYMGIVGTNNWGSTTNGTSTETKTPSAWDTISGLMSSGGKAAQGAAALAPFLMASDRRYKTNITRIGTTDNGLPLYTFEYVGDPEKRMNVGLMAQDVELVNPEAVTELNGIKVVDYGKALSYYEEAFC